MKRSTVALATLPMFAFTALISASAQAATKTAAKTGAKPKPVVPAPGKSCAASNVGIPVAGEGSVLLDCIKSGSRYVWQVSKSALATTTLAPTTTAAVAVAAAPATTVAKSDKWPDKIVFAPVPSENSSIALATWSPFVKALEKELGIKVEQVSVSDYAAVVEGQLSGKVDLAMYGPFSYYVAKAAGAKIDPIAVQVSDIGASPSYQSYMIAPANSSAKGIADAKGRKVCFSDNLSTSGFLYPTSGLLDVGLESGKDYTAVFAGGHDKSVAAVKAGTCDVGFAFDDMVNRTAVSAGIIKPGDLKVIWQSNAIPNSPIAVRNELPTSLVAKIKAAIPKLDTLYLQAGGFCSSANRFGCNAGGSNAWVLVNESFFQPIADVCNKTKAAACFPAKK